MKHKLLILAGVLAVVAVLGGFYGKPVAAQIRGLLVQDVDQPARAPLQQSFYLTQLGGNPVTIPKGYRLVVDYVCAQGSAYAAPNPPDTSTNNGTQPLIVLTTPAGSSTQKYPLYLQQSPTIYSQWSGSWPVTIYADSLTVGLGYSGYSPEAGTFAFDIMVSGHLVFVGKGQ